MPMPGGTFYLYTPAPKSARAAWPSNAEAGLAVPDPRALDLDRAVGRCRRLPALLRHVRVRRARKDDDRVIAELARGFENFLADIGAEPAFARRLLSAIIDRNLAMMENFIALDEIDGVLMGSDWGSQLDTLMSVDIWDDLIRPGEQKMYDLVRSAGKEVWIHSCGNIRRLIPRLIDMGVQVLNPIQPEAMDIAELKRSFGDRLAFWGGISTQKTLPYGTPDEVRAEARQVRNLLAQGGGYVFSPAQSIQSDVPVPNILALLEVARENR
jgi:uroporphyrinogen decarboxylase